MPQDLTQSSKKILVDLINQSSGTSYAEIDLNFGTPEDWSGDDERYDTTVGVNKAAFPDAEDTQAIYYKRIDLGAVFTAKVVEIEYKAGIDSVAELLPYLNSRYGFGFDSGDIVDTAINTGGTFPVSVVIKAKADSLIYKGQFSVDLTKEAPAVVGDTTTANTTLAGGYIDGSSKFRADVTVTATNFIKTVKDDGTLTLALRARGEVAGPVAPAATGDYKIAEATPAGGNWKLDVAIGSDIVGGRMEAQHEFLLRFESDNDAIVFPLVLAYSAGTYTLRNDAYGVALAAGYAAGDGSLVEFSIDMAELATANGFSNVLENAVLNSDGAPAGVFDISLIATNIATPATKHYVQMVVDTSGA